MIIKQCGAVNGANYHYDYYPIECLRFHNKSIAKTATQKRPVACSSGGKLLGNEKNDQKKKYKKNNDKLTTEFTDKLTLNFYHDIVDSSTDDDVEE